MMSFFVDMSPPCVEGRRHFDAVLKVMRKRWCPDFKGRWVHDDLERPGLDHIGVSSQPPRADSSRSHTSNRRSLNCLFARIRVIIFSVM